MRTIMAGDPWFTMFVIVVGLGVPLLGLISRYVTRKLMEDAPESYRTDIERDAAMIYHALPAHVRAKHELDEAVFRLGQAITSATAEQIQEAFDVLSAALMDEKKGRASSPAWLEVIEVAESQVRQPQRYHAIETDEGWIVASVENGMDVIHEVYTGDTSEADARRTAVVKNLVLQESQEMDEWRAQQHADEEGLPDEREND